MQEPQEEEKPEQPLAIEILPPLKNKPWEPSGGPMTIFRIKLMSPQQIAEYGLGKYIKGANDDEENE